MPTIAVTGQILIHGPLDFEASKAIRMLLDADIAFANLEATVDVAGAWPTKTKTLHLASPDALVSLRALGFHAVTHANNHAFDLGPPGIAATRAAAASAGLALAGSGVDLAEATAPALLRAANGTSIALFAADLGPQPDIVYASVDRAGIAPLRMKRAVAVPAQEYETLCHIVRTLGDDRREAARSAVGYRALDTGQDGLEIFGTRILNGVRIEPHWTANEDDLQRLVLGIRSARAEGHLVALSLHSHHWDPEWQRTPAWLTELARGLIDEGADLVIGTGAPVLQGISFHRGRPILGSLGNFAFHTRRAATYDKQGTDVWRSVAVRLTLTDDGSCSSIEILPIAIGRPAEDNAIAHAPVPLDADDAQEIFDRFIADLCAAERTLIKLAGIDELARR